MADHFLCKTIVEDTYLLENAAGLVIEGYDKLYNFIVEKLGEEDAGFFTEPMFSPGNDRTKSSVSWYSDYDGDYVNLNSCEGDDRVTLENELDRIVQAFSSLLNDPECGALLGQALYLLNTDSILVINRRLVVINWGMTATKVDNGANLASQAKHFAAGLGAFVKLCITPPVSEQNWIKQSEASTENKISNQENASGSQDENIQRGHQHSGQGQQVHSVEHHNSTHAPMQPAGVTNSLTLQDQLRDRWWYIVPMVITILILLIVIIWLLIPGHRFYPLGGDFAKSLNRNAESIQRNTHSALEERIAQLQTEIEGAVCHLPADGSFPDAPPEGISPSGEAASSMQNSAQGENVEPAQAEDSTEAPVQPDGLRSLQDKIDSSTVLILTENSLGTGFFVAPDMIMTNHHVIDGSPKVFVVGKTLDGIKQAEILSSNGPFETTGQDFALLKVSGLNNAYFDFYLPPEIPRLTSIVATGFPGDVMEGNRDFQQLFQGEVLESTPQVVITDGIISYEQPLENNVNVIIHTADLSGGNSGGPLLDYCGRVLGVNTMVRVGEMRSLNLALKASDAISFISRAGHSLETVNNPCQRGR